MQPFNFNIYWNLKKKQVVPVEIHFMIQFQSFAEVFMLAVQRLCFCCTCAMFVPLILPVETMTSSIQEAAVICTPDVMCRLLSIEKVKLIPEFRWCRMKQVRPTFHHVWKQVLQSHNTHTLRCIVFTHTHLINIRLATTTSLYSIYMFCWIIWKKLGLNTVAVPVFPNGWNARMSCSPSLCLACEWFIRRSLSTKRTFHSDAATPQIIDRASSRSTYQSPWSVQ